MAIVLVKITSSSAGLKHAKLLAAVRNKSGVRLLVIAATSSGDGSVWRLGAAQGHDEGGNAYNGAVMAMHQWSLYGANPLVRG